MAAIQPTVEFFDGIAENPSNVSLRRGKRTGNRTVLMRFTTLNALSGTNSFLRRSFDAMKLTDEEGVITVQPSSTRLAFGGDDGDDFEHLDVAFEIQDEGHWERFMRFMHRYAEANGMAFGESGAGAEES